MVARLFCINDKEVMRNLLSIIMLLVFSVSLYGQNDVTKFLGIPVDGSKTAMIQKLKAKGFQYNNTLECLEGEFNGRDVLLHIVTNNNKVWRVMVADATTSSETDIKIRFNHLCRQFSNNKKYMPVALSDYSLSDEEDISYEMLVNKKRYEAAYYQLPEVADSAAIAEEVRSIFLSKYAEEQLANPTEEIKKEMITTSVDYLLEKYSKKSVWFMINEQYGRYGILMFYDNEYNHSNGEDL